MANIIINAALSKAKKELPSGIMVSIKGKRDSGIIDNRKVTYEKKTVFDCGLKWDKNKKTLYLVDEQKNSNANIGIFVSNYPLRLAKGKMLISEEVTNTKDIAAISFKLEHGGFDNEAVKIVDGIVGIDPKPTKLFLHVGTDPDRLIIVNEKGFNFVCDFKKKNWFVLKPNSSQLELYDYNNDIEIKDLIKEKLPFPGLDKNLYDNPSLIEFDKIDIVKHAIKHI